MMKPIRMFCAIALIAAAPSLAWAGSTINVKLLDKGDGMDMSKMMGLGMGMNGDMKMAPMSITTSNKFAVRGKVTFNVTNLSKTMIHEMIVAPIKDENTALPYLDAENRVDEDKAADLGEVSELDPGKTGSLTLDMKPGKYILYCNVPAHYAMGMWTILEVK
ncbi:MAG: plastocyanin/azurin family copper-binding protein [Aestuariivirga sp.]